MLVKERHGHEHRFQEGTDRGQAEGNKGGKAVKAIWTKNSKLGVVLLAVAALMVAMPPARTLAGPDSDGFVTEGNKNWCGTQESFTGLQGDGTPDLFVVLGNQHSIDFNTHIQNGFVQSLTKGNLQGIRVHNATGNTCSDRQVFQGISQKAVHIHENLDLTSDNPLGICICERCTPNGWDQVAIFTERIRQDIKDNCPAGWTCKVDRTEIQCTGGDSGNCYQSGSPFFNHYLKHIVAHEIGHNLYLTLYMGPDGTYHYDERKKVIMSNRVFIKTHGNTATWHITGQWKKDSKDNYRLK
jgi:hypothetical protein